MIFRGAAPDLSPARRRIAQAYRADEAAAVTRLLGAAELAPPARARVEAKARALVEAVRAARRESGGIDAFMHEFSLSSAEGVVLMCLAEALLRIPDADTADALIHDKIAAGDWEKHVGKGPSFFVNASTWGLMLTGRILRWEDRAGGGLGGVLARLVARSGEPVIRQAVREAIRILGRQFVMGRTIGEALDRARAFEAEGARHSYDMLGEGARTAADAVRYFDSYAAAIDAIGEAARSRGPAASPGISVKLSALHPRYEHGQRARVMNELVPRLAALADRARRYDIGFTVDAEEADRLDLSLDVIDAVAVTPSLTGWTGLGLAVQAYQKRALPVIDWLAERAAATGRRWMVRLVKGAYWDTEIKRAQERGLEGYPVFTRKAATDASYIACARRLLANPHAFYPQFATHNALTLASILELAGDHREFEFQRLHGMGEALYREIAGPGKTGIACRVYAPVGSHEDLLPYLVRRLLENGANTSFVNRIADDAMPVAALLADPVETLRAAKSLPNASIPLPRDLFGAERRNSAGADLSDPLVAGALSRELAAFDTLRFEAGDAATEQRFEPRDRRRVVAAVRDATPEQVDAALAAAVAAQPEWDRRGGAARAEILESAADAFERETARLAALCVREAGKTVPDALGEVREAVDFLRYYAARARREFDKPHPLPGPTGERNTLALRGRGVFAAISPWNFPLAIFTGQVAAALAAGNAAMAKPAEQTPATAAAAVRLLHEAGVPREALALLPGAGETVGAALTRDLRVAGIVFTGSTEVARIIHKTLAARDGPIVPLIAETGGQNAMIADSSSLPEQVVADAVLSAFNSAGQRCSALRVLFLQDVIADKVIAMLAGAMAELSVGDPAYLDTDVGPVIDEAAQAGLLVHIERMKREARLVAVAPLPAGLPPGLFVAPHAFEIDGIARLEREVFGPILHVVRYKKRHLDRVIDSINATGYGLTLGIHSRVDSHIAHIAARVRAGNVYVNRGMIGAVVGVQPFGGEGLSGTGPKAGGPHYLHRFAVERAVSDNIAAAGGNAALLAAGEG